MILFDNETSGLIKNGLIPLGQQPSIIELGLVKLNDKTLKEVDSFGALFKPPVLPLDPETTRITGITTEQLLSEKPFVTYYREIADFFLGETTLVAHNAPFDAEMLELELRRIDKVKKFPWPMTHICTSERNVDVTGKYIHLHELYELATGQEYIQTHRAVDDARMLIPIVKWMKKRGAL